MEVPELSVVTVDTRGISPSCLDGYKELTCSQPFFDHNFLFHPKVKCIKSKVGELCGLDLVVFFHQHSPGRVRSLEAPPLKPMNTAATRLTFDPRTGHPEYTIHGKAYVVSSGGDYPLSKHQVWGIQEIISQTREVYRNHPSRGVKGLKELFLWCKQYRQQQYGSPIIYTPRKVKESSCSFDLSSLKASYESNDENEDQSNRDGCRECHHSKCSCMDCRLFRPCPTCFKQRPSLRQQRRPESSNVRRVRFQNLR